MFAQNYEDRSSVTIKIYVNFVKHFLSILNNQGSQTFSGDQWNTPPLMCFCHFSSYVVSHNANCMNAGTFYRKPN